MTHDEIPVVFPCEGENLVGIVHRPDNNASQGVLIVVGGPQYRVGSHRHFVLLARDLCRRGVPVMRFDYRGMGDSGGQGLNFMATAPDIASAIDEFLSRVPGMQSVVLWGLCDAASGILAYAHTDARVAAIAILNPWVRSDATLARTRLTRYYAGQLMNRGFWRRLLLGELAVGASLRSLAGTLWTAAVPARADPRPPPGNAKPAKTNAESFQDTMRNGLQAFKGPVLMIMSGDDLTAAEFRDLARTRRWRQALKRSGLTQRELPEANHTFSRHKWRDTVADWTWEWLQSW